MTLFEKRAALREAFRTFFKSKDYLETDSPILVTTPGSEVHLRYFSTEWLNYDDSRKHLWLRSSPEIHMKKIASLGYERIYEIARCFRNKGELSEWHSPEFTMVEWYNKNISFDSFIKETEALIKYCFNHLRESANLQPLNIFQRISMFEAFKRYCNVDLIDQDQELSIKLIENGVLSVNRNDDFETAFFKALLEKIEPELKKIPAIVVYDYPPSQAALSKIENGKAKRFEIYIKGVEICNGFQELLNPEENRKRFATTRARRKQLNYETPNEDEDFFEAMSILNNEQIDMCGNALGFDRLLALICGKDNLNHIVPFHGMIY